MFFGGEVMDIKQCKEYNKNIYFSKRKAGKVKYYPTSFLEHIYKVRSLLKNPTI